MLKNCIIDISRHNGKIDFTKVKKAGVLGVICKSTDGTGYMHTQYYETNIRKAADAGLMTGAYHWVNGRDPVKQADYFLAIANEPGLLHCLDFEDPKANIYLLAKMITRVKDVTGRAPVIYGGALIKAEMGEIEESKELQALLAECPLWLSHYTKNSQPKMPGLPWKVWSIWQYTDKGKISGVSGYVDLNHWNGSEEGLRRLWTGEKAPAATV
jgi:lysozyme